MCLVVAGREGKREGGDEGMCEGGDESNCARGQNSLSCQRRAVDCPIGCGLKWQGGEALLEIAYQLGDLQPDIILNSHELFLGITHWLGGLWSVRADLRALIAFGSKLRGRGRWRGRLSETVGDATRLGVKLKG